MARWTTYHEPPSSAGEPQPVRDAWEARLAAQAEADAALREATAEIEIS
jgi:hypothetical protein